MSNITMEIRKNTVSASAFLPGQAYKSALALAAAYEGEIGETDLGFFKATFNSAKTAKQFGMDWQTAYNANRKPAPASKPASAGKGRKPPKSPSLLLRRRRTSLLTAKATPSGRRHSTSSQERAQVQTSRQPQSCVRMASFPTVQSGIIGSPSANTHTSSEGHLVKSPIPLSCPLAGI